MNADLWDEIRINAAILIEKGPSGAGHRIAKKLQDAKGIYELIASLGNRQPRLFFYERPGTGELIFVDAFFKTGGKKDYGPAIKRAQERRRAIEAGNVRSTGVQFSRYTH